MATATRMSLDEFLALEPCEPELEFMDGEAYQKPMVGKTHSRLVARLVQLLMNYMDSSGLGDVDTELRHIDRRHAWVFIPDVSVTLRERLAGHAFEENKPVDVLPDFAIEVLSPDDRPGRVTRKIAHYMQSGVPLLWVIDPEGQEVTAWRPGETPETVSHPGTISAGPVLPDFSVDLAALFAVVGGQRQPS